MDVATETNISRWFHHCYGSENSYAACPTQGLTKLQSKNPKGCSLSVRLSRDPSALGSLTWMPYLFLFSCEPREPISLLAFGPRDVFSLQMLPWSSLLQPLPPEDPQSSSLLLQYEPEEPSAIPSNGRPRQEVTRFQAWIPKENCLKTSKQSEPEAVRRESYEHYLHIHPFCHSLLVRRESPHLPVHRRKTLYESDLWGSLSGIPTRVSRIK